MAEHGERERYRQHIIEGSEPCSPCREAERVHKADYRRRIYLNRGPMLVDSTGTRRRIEALAAIGWPAKALAERAGCTFSNVRKWTSNDRVRVDTRDTVRRLYDELSMTPGPSDVVRRIARQKGWPVPLCWDDDTIDDPQARPRTGKANAGGPVDEIAVERAMAGDPVRLSPRERAEAVRRLTALDLSAEQIAERLDVAKRSVVRHRTAARTGCTVCSSEETVTVDGVHGRRCVDHPPTYDRTYALAAVDRGDPGLAFAHLRAHLAFQAGAR